MTFRTPFGLDLAVSLSRPVVAALRDAGSALLGVADRAIMLKVK